MTDNICLYIALYISSVVVCLVQSLLCYRYGEKSKYQEYEIEYKRTSRTLYNFSFIPVVNTILGIVVIFINIYDFVLIIFDLFIMFHSVMYNKFIKIFFKK